MRRLFIEKYGLSPDRIDLVNRTDSDKESSEEITDPALEEHRAAIIIVEEIE